MSTNVTYQPVQKISIRAEEKLPAFRFVSHGGTLCTAGSKSLGTVEREWLEGTNSSIITLGTVPIETSGTVHVGDSLTADADGKAKTAGVGDEINGRALEDFVGAGIVKILLVP